MKFLARITSIISAHLNDKLDDVEAAHAGTLAKDDLRQLDEQLAETTRAVSQLGAEVERQGDLRDDLQAEITRWSDIATKQAQAGNDDLARQALARKLDAQEQMRVCMASYDSLKARFEAAKTKVLDDTQRLEAAKQKVRIVAAREKVADAADAADKMFGDLGDHQDLFRHIDQMEETITQRERAANIARDIADQASGKTLERVAAEHDRNAAIEAELAALKSPSPSAPTA